MRTCGCGGNFVLDPQTNIGGAKPLNRMRRKISQLAYLAACALVCVSAQAEWTDSSTIRHVYSHDGLYFIDTALAVSPCGTPGRFWWPTSDSDAKDMYAMVLLAVATGKPIAVVYDASSPACDNGGALVTHMRISE